MRTLEFVRKYTRESRRVGGKHLSRQTRYLPHVARVLENDHVVSVQTHSSKVGRFLDEGFKDRWRLMDEKSRSDLINQGHQKARSMLDKQFIKVRDSNIGFPP